MDINTRVKVYQAQQYLRENSKSCGLWPECGCHETLERWAIDLSDERRIWDLEVLQAGEINLFVSLCCIAKHCPDKETKLYARRQLMKDFWSYQKSLSVKGWRWS